MLYFLSWFQNDQSFLNLLPTYLATGERKCSLAVMPLLRCIYLRYSTSLADSENTTLVVTLSSYCLSTVLLYWDRRCFVNKSVLLSQSSCQVTLIIRSHISHYGLICDMAQSLKNNQPDVEFPSCTSGGNWHEGDSNNLKSGTSLM